MHVSSEMTGDGVCCLDSVVRGYNMYKSLWPPITGEQLDVVLKDKSKHDVRAVTIMNTNTFIPSDEIVSATHLQIWYHTADNAFIASDKIVFASHLQIQYHTADKHVRC